MGEKNMQFEKTSKQKKKKEASLVEWLMAIALSSIIPFFPPFSKVFFTSIFNTLSPHMMYYMFEKE